jgi:hypothetical protein
VVEQDGRRGVPRPAERNEVRSLSRAVVVEHHLRVSGDEARLEPLEERPARSVVWLLHEWVHGGGTPIDLLDALGVEHVLHVEGRRGDDVLFEAREVCAIKSRRIVVEKVEQAGESPPLGVATRHIAGW